MIDQNPTAAANDNHADDVIRHQEFGVKLREARVAAGLSIDDVSETLKLKEDLIKALENSQVEKLPVSAFTQGYIRSYCRLLKLPAEELIELYNKMTPQQEVPLVQTSGVSVQRTSRDGGVKTITFLLVAVGIFLVLLWWFQNDIDNPLLDQTVVTKAIDDQMIDQGVTETVNEIVTETQTEEQAVIQEDSITSEEVPAVEQALPTTSNATDIEKKPVPIQAEEVKRPILPGDDVLVIRSNADSWTEIEDANGQRLLFQLVRAGDYHQLQGRAPFRIFLGNAPSVEIAVNSQSINLSAHIRQNNIAHVLVKGNATAQTVRGLVRETSNNTNSNEQPAE